MYESLLHGQCPSDNSYSGYLKVEEGKNNWIEYWVAIRDNRILLYSDECSEESGEEAMKTIELSSETRCELLQRRNYHFRFKLVLGANSLYKLKCSSAFHRQQWISQIMLASSKERVVELNGSAEVREGNHKRTLSTESQLSSDAESLYESELESSSTFSDGGTAQGRLNTPDSETENPVKTTTDRRESKGLLRRLSFKATNRLRRNSNSSPRGEFSDPGTPSPSSPAMRQTESPIRGSPIRGSPASSPKVNKVVDLNKVFVNPAFVPSPSASPAMARKTEEIQEIDLIDIS